MESCVVPLTLCPLAASALQPKGLYATSASDSTDIVAAAGHANEQPGQQPRVRFDVRLQAEYGREVAKSGPSMTYGQWRVRAQNALVGSTHKGQNSRTRLSTT